MWTQFGLLAAAVMFIGLSARQRLRSAPTRDKVVYWGILLIGAGLGASIIWMDDSVPTPLLLLVWVYGPVQQWVSWLLGG